MNYQRHNYYKQYPNAPGLRQAKRQSQIRMGNDPGDYDDESDSSYEMEGKSNLTGNYLKQIGRIRQQNTPNNIRNYENSTPQVIPNTYTNPVKYSFGKKRAKSNQKQAVIKGYSNSYQLKPQNRNLRERSMDSLSSNLKRSMISSEVSRQEYMMQQKKNSLIEKHKRARKETKVEISVMPASSDGILEGEEEDIEINDRSQIYSQENPTIKMEDQGGGAVPKMEMKTSNESERMETVEESASEASDIVQDSSQYYEDTDDARRPVNQENIKTHLGYGTHMEQQHKTGKNFKYLGFENSLKDQKIINKSKSMAQSFDVDKDSKERIKEESLKKKSRRGRDAEPVFEKKQQDHVNTSSDMRKVFIDAYGVELDFAGFYYSSAKFIPNQKDMVINVCWHIVPEGQKKVVQTTTMKNTFSEMPYESIYDQSGKGILIQLLKPKQKVFMKIKEIQVHHMTHIIIEFSKDGKLMGLYNKRDKCLSIFHSDNMYKCLDKIAQGKPHFKIRIHFDDDVENSIDRIVFDANDKFIAIISKQQIRIINLKKKDNQTVFLYTIPEQYEKILDVVINSKNVADKPFNCQIACGWEHGRKIVGIFDIHDDNNPEKIRQILCREWGNKLTCKISDDINHVVFSNGIEHYILKGKSQDFFPHIGEKTIHGCIYHHNIFHFINSCDQYDRDIVIQNSENKSAKAKIARSLEPGQIRVFDAQIYHENGKQDQCFLKVLMNQGDYLFLDTIDLNKSNDMSNPLAKYDAHINTTSHKYYMAYGFNWPYFSYASKYNYIFILNAFNPNFIQRYELPKHVVRIDFTFLTDTHDLYAICEVEQGYEVYNVDLDSVNPYLEGPVLRYSFESVKNQELLSFHVRASSRKEKINLNKALIFFMMHGHTFYGWCEGDGQKVIPVNSLADEPDGNAHCSNYYYCSDDSLFFMISREEKIGKRFVLHSEIKQVECQFGSYKVTDIYQDKDKRAEILNFGVDNTNNRLLILSGVKNAKNKRDKFATLFSYNRDKIIFTMRIKNPEIIGRLKSNLYNFVGGHIYYNNKVIKIRYDLLDASQAIMSLEEDMIFDHYSNILCIEQDDEVQSGTPLQTCLYNRLAYVIKNQKRLKPRKVLVLPYLHERKLYLNRRHSANQFYNLMKHQNGVNYITCLCVPEHKMYIYSEMGILIDRIDYSEIAAQYGKPIVISENGTIFLFRKKQDSPQIHKIMVHLDKLEYVNTIDIQQRLNDFFDLNKEKLNKEYILEVNALAGIFPDPLGLFSSKKSKQDEALKEQRYQSKVHFFNNVLKKVENLKNIHIQFFLNDDGEVLLRLQAKDNTNNKLKEFKEYSTIETVNSASAWKDVQSVAKSEHSHHEGDTEYRNRSLMYFIPNENIQVNRDKCKSCYSCSKEGQEQENKNHELDLTPDAMENREFIYFDSEDDEVYNLQGISMNQDFIFFWNRGKVWKLHMATQVLSEIGIYIDEDEAESYIKQACTSSNKGRLYIRVHQSPTMDCMIIWDLWRDVEMESFDIRCDSLFMQDRLGNVYLAENDYIINCEQQCKLKCYRFQVQDFESSQYPFNHGYRFDDQMHNYVLMRNYVNLSFSYMTFIIKANFENGGYLQKNFLFDQEGYDYILKRNTIFTEGQLVTQDYDKLHFILQAFSKIDQVLFEQLFYCNDIGQSPLHIAVSVNNTRMVNLILQFLSHCQNAGINTLKNIFKDLIDYKDFSTYLLSAPFQTFNMEQKQTLQLPPINNSEEIIKVSPSKSSYVDVAYFEDIMGEDKLNTNYQTYACKIFCVRADWILNDEDGIGMEFMQSMLKKKNRDIFMTPYMQIIIEFLYEKYSRRIKLMLLPPYLGHLVFVNIQLFVNENLRALKEDKEHHPNDQLIKEDLFQATATANTVIAICGMFNFVNMIVFIMQSKNMGFKVLLRAWSVVDMIIIITNSITVGNLVFDIPIRNIRLVESILIFSQWFKCLYYMRLVNSISPLIESIFVIIQNMLYFLFIFCIGIVAFAETFYSIGKNQVMLQESDGISGDDIVHPDYASIGGAFAQTYMSALGQLDISQYGNGPMAPILYFLFILLSFIMCIHMLNMLIAIMGQSFDRNEEISDSNKKISQLEFVVNNWWIHPIKDKKKIIYFISAFTIKDDDENFGKLEQMGGEIQEMKQMIINQHKQMNEIQYQISQLGAAAK